MSIDQPSLDLVQHELVEDDSIALATSFVQLLEDNEMDDDSTSSLYYHTLLSANQCR